MKTRQVAVDANPAARAVTTGTELFAREVCRRLPHIEPAIGWRFYSSRAANLDFDLMVLPFPRLWSQARLPFELAARKPNLFFAPSHVVPVWCPAPALMVVHDLAFERFPEAYGRAALAYLRFSTSWAESRCETLIAVSESTRQDMANLHGVDPARVVVVHPGGGEAPPAPDPAQGERLLRGLDINRPFVLHVGRVEPRKNQLAVLKAAERIPGLQLVCAGPVIDQGMAARLEASPQCRVLGHVTSEVREYLYATASALVFPSLYEGFGFPVVEAMARGLPVVVSRTSSLPEIAGEAALYVDDPTDSDGLAAQVERLLDSSRLRTQLVEAGRARASRFTWQATAEGVAAVIRGLL